MTELQSSEWFRVPPPDDTANTLVQEVQELKKSYNAIILAHRYQRIGVQQIADVIGDSYDLSVAATKTSAPTIVFCGVRFMAETTKLLNPMKTVLLPESMAGCALADTITAAEVRSLKQEHPDASVVMYINCSAEVKAECDAICTSANAQKVIEAMPTQKVIFGPDRNLAERMKQRCSKELIIAGGYCPVHKEITREMLESTLAKYPDAIVLVHPECNPDVQELADAVLGTTGMVEHVRMSKAKRFIIGTEQGLIQKMQLDFPEKEIHPIYRHKSCDESCACPFMKLTKLASVKRALVQGTEEITVPAHLAPRALRAVQRMMEIGK
ncbi:MAG TPA: quinolinate synthase NadA [Candidatus Nanoarchaeia archaeon]|nr:quinolinate synthase NadA [Candidatus Nanoarchaeia archaeon]